MQKKGQVDQRVHICMYVCMYVFQEPCLFRFSSLRMVRSISQEG